MSFEQDLDIYLRARFTLICIVSAEEERVIAQVKRLAESSGRGLYAWDHADFFSVLAGSSPALPTAKDPLSALEAIEKHGENAVFILRDFHQCWDNQPRVIRKLRTLAQKLKYTRKSILITLPACKLPPELRNEAVIIEVPPPDTADLEQILDGLTSAPGVRIDLTSQTRQKIISNALGLSSSQAQRVFAQAIVSHGVLDERDLALIQAEKRQIIRESGALEFFPPRETVADVGGLDALKEWLRTREAAFSPAASEYGLPSPKGIVLLGIPGTGKSLTAKAVANLWQIPLIRMDLGALFGSLVGQSEENTRRALTLAETVAPCILWIDEIEKGLSVGDHDGGTSLRVFGSLLSWMQEKTRPVFIVATANNIALLPPELLRRGRFDEIFFLDLPTAAERRAIFEVHIRKRKRFVDNYNLDRLVQASEGYVGAEIEQAVIDAMYRAFNDLQNPRREFTTEDILACIARLIPMSRSQRELIASLRQWLTEGRAQSASFREAARATDECVRLEINPPSSPSLDGTTA